MIGEADPRSVTHRDVRGDRVGRRAFGPSERRATGRYRRTIARTALGFNG